MTTPKPQPTGRPPLRLTGILFGTAACLLLVTTADMLVSRFGLPSTYVTLATVVAPVLAGILTALYVRTRGGMHAMIGSLLALPIMVIVVFGGVWQPAVLAFAFCTLGAALTEIVLRRRMRS
jgi:hypothetical protein